MSWLLYLPVPARIRPGRWRIERLKDERGIAAVEFALILPFLLTLMFGMAALTERMQETHRIELVADTIADLAAQKSSGGDAIGQAAITDADVAELFKAAEFLISPLPAANLHIDIYELRLSLTSKVVSNGGIVMLSYSYAPYVVWRANQNGLNYLQCSTLLSAGSDGPNSLASEYVNMATWDLSKARYIIVTHVRYDYTSPFGYGLFSWGTSATSTSFRAGHAQNRNTYSPAHIQNKTTGAAVTCPSMPA